MGASTPSGFCSLFSGLHFPEQDWRLYIIKGGPGTGKSTLMKKVAHEAEKRGLYFEKIFCSSDPSSLDAVIIPSLKISLADGTAPHVIEPQYPGVSEITIDLGQFRNNEKLNQSRDKIIELTKKNKARHKKCTDFLYAAKGVDNDTASIIASSLKIERLHKFAEKLAGVKLSSYSDNTPVTAKRFLSALTSEGYVVFRDTVSCLCEDIYVLDDPYGHAAAVILKVLSIKAREQGIDSIICHCPMSPEYKAEHLIFPDLSLGFYTSNRYHPDDFRNAKHIDCKRFLNTDILSRHKNRIAFNNRSRDELLTEALNNLTNAKLIHDELEKYYINAMDFTSLAQFSDNFIQQIFR